MLTSEILYNSFFYYELMIFIIEKEIMCLTLRDYATKYGLSTHRKISCLQFYKYFVITRLQQEIFPCPVEPIRLIYCGALELNGVLLNKLVP